MIRRPIGADGAAGAVPVIGHVMPSTSGRIVVLVQSHPFDQR
jgi:hypothetical protein